MTTQLALPRVPPHAPVDADVWAAFAARWAQLEADHLVRPARISPVTAFRWAKGCWVVAAVNGREWSGHGDDAADAAELVFGRAMAR